MGKVRYVKSTEDLRLAEKYNPEFLPSSLEQVRARYETDPEVAAAVLPKPLALARPEVGVTISKVSIHLGPGFDVDIGAALFGVAATYEGTEGLYLITMPMTTEGAVVGGRETYGEPKKIAAIDFSRDGADLTATVTRQNVPYLQVKGRIGESTEARKFTEHAYCYKCLPALARDKVLEFDPLLVRLEWHHEFPEVRPFDGDVILTESPFDPVVDLPVRRMVGMTYEKGTTQSSGQVLRSVPAEWLVPFLHQRYDDMTGFLASLDQNARAAG
jgi:acetoacetate decarboxylase